MFAANVNQYMKAKHGKFPEVEVTREEFIRLMMEEQNLTKEKAEFQATIAEGLGSSCMIGDRLVKIKEEKTTDLEPKSD